MLDIKLEGDWPGVQMDLRRLDSMVQSSATWGMRKATEQIAKNAKKHINHQDLGWPQRSSNYNANDPRIMVDTEAYYGAIEAYKVGDTYYAGVKPNRKNQDGTPIKEYALMNEYGGGNLPPRPLWEPSVRDVGGPKGIRSIVVLSIYKKVQALRARGFTVTIGTI